MRLLPRDERFFDLFTKVAELNVEASQLLTEILKADNERRLPLVEAMKRCEHSADEATHEVVQRLDRSFITPLDREDIHMLASRLDDILDIMDGTARRVQIFRPGKAPEGALMIAETITKACTELLNAVRMMELGFSSPCILPNGRAMDLAIFRIRKNDTTKAATGRPLVIHECDLPVHSMDRTGACCQI